MFSPLLAAAELDRLASLGGLLWLIPSLPLLAALLLALLGPILREHSHGLSIAAIVAAFGVSLFVFTPLWSEINTPHDDDTPVQPLVVKSYYPWIQIEPGKPGGVDIGMTLRVDALTAMMLLMINFIAALIALYSAGYMHGEPGYARFFAAVSGFVAAMNLLVMADNLLVLYAGWEGVGLCSYLLIGFWYAKPSAAEAARKAFLVTRLGDVGLFLGILMLWYGTGSLSYDEVFAKLQEGVLSEPFVLTAALLVFCGAAGKSAQFPLHVWLPDAMEGPTPVSALIHAATMVTAGVYLVARCTPLFMLVPAAQLTVAVLGGFTALLAALIALTQTDLKRVLAYSTLSQLGYMFLGLGCATKFGGPGLVTFAVVAAMFHLLTHAFFKALLFLAAGSVMHGMGHVIDMRRFSGLRQVMPTTHATFLVGALTLAGFPLLSGFWSKDEILAAAQQASETGSYGASTYFVLLIVALVTAFLTAFYTFRAYFLTFWGPLRVPAEADHTHSHHDDHEATPRHSHSPSSKKPAVERDSPHPKASYESPAVMTIPLVVLAVFALGIGALLAGPHTFKAVKALSFAHFVEATPGLPAADPHQYQLTLMLLSSLLAVLGIGLAYLLYVVQPSLPAQLARSLGLLYQFSRDKFYVDEIYHVLIVLPLQGLANLLAGLDRHGVDATVSAAGSVPRWLGQAFRPMQNGLVQFYALAMVLGLTVFLLALVRSL
ncbi:MAG: NADH-quinone oxidoreductase subunit L [Gemmataceae bacterium]